MTVHVIIEKELPDQPQYSYLGKFVVPDFVTALTKIVWRETGDCAIRLGRPAKIGEIVDGIQWGAYKSTGGEDSIPDGTPIVVGQGVGKPPAGRSVP
jgi:hypothetical protein